MIGDAGENIGEPRFWKENLYESALWLYRGGLSADPIIIDHLNWKVPEFGSFA